MTPRENFCSSCEKKRKEEGKSPRPLIRLPMGIAQESLKPGLPIRLCTVCDGDAYKEAIRHYEERTGKK